MNSNPGVLVVDELGVGLNAALLRLIQGELIAIQILGSQTS